ncbi:MAG TPA: MFS transporter [Nitrososphaeraceae archaeon]
MFTNDRDAKDESCDIGNSIDNLGRIPIKRGVIIAISLAGFFALYDVSNFQYISPILKSDWHLTDAEIAYAISMRVIGQVIGAFCITICADFYGRKPALLVSLIILVIGSILVAISTNIFQVSIFRLITGIGIGAEIVIATAYIGEISPKSKRGRYTSFIFLIGSIGFVASGPVSFVLLQQYKTMGIEDWRVLMAIPGVVALLLLPLRYGMLESPRWMLSKGKIKEARLLLMKLGLPPIQNQDINPPSIPRGNVMYAFKNKKILSRMSLFISLWFLILAAGTASNLLVVEYVNQGYTITQSVAITTISSIGYAVGACLSISIADKIERKHQFVVAALIMGFAFVLRGLLIQDYVVLGIAGFIGFAANAWVLACLFTYTAENFPTRIRSIASGAAEGLGSALAAIGPIIFVLLRPFGFLNVMIGLASFLLAAAAVIILFGNRSVGMSLEQLNKIDHK